MNPDDQIQLYLEVKKAFYRAKQAELKKHGLNWNSFKELEAVAKNEWKRLIAERGYIELGEGLIAVGVEKELRLYQGKGQVIDTELNIQIHQKA